MNNTVNRLGLFKWVTLLHCVSKKFTTYDFHDW